MELCNGKFYISEVCSFVKVDAGINRLLFLGTVLLMFGLRDTRPCFEIQKAPVYLVKNQVRFHPILLTPSKLSLLLVFNAAF